MCARRRAIFLYSSRHASEVRAVPQDHAQVQGEEKKCVVVEIGDLRDIRRMCDKEEELTNELTAGLDKREAKKIEKLINVGLLMLHNKNPLEYFNEKYGKSPKAWVAEKEAGEAKKRAGKEAGKAKKQADAVQ